MPGHVFKAINPRLSDADFGQPLRRYLFAQPVCGVVFRQVCAYNHSGVFIADTTAYYPEDRGGESIDFGGNEAGGGGDASEILCKRMKTSSGHQFQLFVLTGGAAAHR